MIRWIALAFAVAAPVTALADSPHGCAGLDGQHSFASVEGSEGVFYRIDPDLHLYHPFSDATADQLAELSQTLAAQGTTLVYVPLPTRGLAMPEFLPAEARDLGYDASIASTLYIDLLERLASRSVLAVDARLALRAPAGEDLSFFRTDPRLTAAGARRLAQALALVLAATPGFDALPKARFETRSSGVAVLPSRMRAALQRHCLMTLPEVEAEAFATTLINQGDGAPSDGQNDRGRIAVVGTEISSEIAANLPGFLSQIAGLEVRQYAVADGGSFAAISAYLTSREFQEARPAYLVWLNPIDSSLADWGDQPLQELIAAAGDSCRIALPIGRSAGATTLIADLSGLEPGRPVTLFVDADAVLAREARFDFAGPDGQVRSRGIHRHPDQVANGRFYMPMSGLWPEGARMVEVVLDVPFGPNGRVTACLG